MHIDFESLCNASKHMNMHISNAINQSSWACSSYLCASLVQEFWSISFLQCCSLFVHVHVLPLLLWAFISYLSPLYNLNLKAFISLYNLSPLVINFQKGCASHWCKGMHFGIDDWGLNLAFFMDIFMIVGMTLLVTCITCILCRASWNTTHRIFSWYQFVWHLPLCDSMCHPFYTLEFL